jgi:hypothetical protein
MNREFIGRAVRVWAVVAAALLVWLAVATISGASANHTYHSQLNHASQRSHFWRVVAGQDEDSAPTVDNKLAYDLRNVINGNSGKITVNTFTGDSNSYGGVTDALGVSPFDNSCGNECGHLTPYMKASLNEVKGGQLQSVIGNDTVKKPHSSRGTAFMAFLFWLLLGAGIIALPFINKYRFKNTLRGQYRDECRLIDETTAAIRELPAGDPQIDQLKGLRDNLEKELQRRLGKGTSEGRINHLKDELQNTLTAVQEGNKMLDT